MKHTEHFVALDPESQHILKDLENAQKHAQNRVPGVRTVLVVLSSRGMAFDLEALRLKITSTYKDAVVFFRSTRGVAIGADAPGSVDLLIDFTGPRQKQPLFYAKKLRKISRVAVGRNAGFFRAGSYDRIINEKDKDAVFPKDVLEKECAIQKLILGLVGIDIQHAGSPAVDLGRTIALK